MVCDEYGTRKTTLTRIALREVGQSVIYIDTSADIENFIHSSWSRARALIEIDDISREESLNYLINKHRIKTVKKGKIDITDQEQSIEVIEHKILVKVENKFRTAKLLKDDEHYK
ncbi:3961_t:CDS:2, partial [Cetraspora pellucida]